MSRHEIEGGCHCGNVRYMFAASKAVAALGLRACQCDFCRAHGARTTSDPNGAMRIRIRDREKLQRYRFGLKTADFLICSACGVFIGALMTANGKRFFTVNANTFKPPPAYDIIAVAKDFSAEDSGGRTDRRAQLWTPVAEFVE
jgi:hypothetical protein